MDGLSHGGAAVRSGTTGMRSCTHRALRKLGAHGPPAVADPAEKLRATIQAEAMVLVGPRRGLAPRLSQPSSNIAAEGRGLARSQERSGTPLLCPNKGFTKAVLPV